MVPVANKSYDERYLIDQTKQITLTTRVFGHSKFGQKLMSVQMRHLKRNFNFETEAFFCCEI